MMPCCACRSFDFASKLYRAKHRSIVRLWVACWLLFVPAVSAEEKPCVLYSNHRLLPANLEFEADLRETLAKSTELNAEFLVGLPTDAIPDDAIVRFKSPTLLEQYATETVVATVVFLVQAGLIAGLLFERRHRRRMKLAVYQQCCELAHASRLAVAEALTGAIAHEINQPLGAILSNADAADLLLASGADRRDELRAILADIRQDDLRASEVIRRLRALLAKQPVDWHPFDLNEAIRELEPVLRAEARRCRVALDLRLAATAPLLLGDRIQIQQVLINLALNAMDAANGLPEARRAVAVSVEHDADRLILVVRDRGPGIAPEHLPQLFDSFFSTKSQGMGLGLSITRTLVEAHGGRV
ncbi:hypothetical protein GJ668_18835, partial [Allochromatium palmeri]|nr:hypothetical protein [Allochromatium palmeri]